jgi:hypothetical protein
MSRFRLTPCFDFVEVVEKGWHTGAQGEVKLPTNFETSEAHATITPKFSFSSSCEIVGDYVDK